MQNGFGDEYMKAIGFDLGRTLVGDENIPLSWKSLYKEALIDSLLKCNSDIDHIKIGLGEEILLKYNTRTNYREYEVSSDIIFSEILSSWELSIEVYLETVKETFFKYFQRNVKLYEDSISTLKALKAEGIKIGILTDVPYGMDKKYVLKDIEEFEQYVDIILSSVEVGYRKPNKQGYIMLLKELGVNAEEMIYVGDEEKDIIGANNLGIYSVLIDRANSSKNYGQKKTIKKLSQLISMK
jgi:putative hydrolase of the HAD superfamily